MVHSPLSANDAQANAGRHHQALLLDTERGKSFGYLLHINFGGVFSKSAALPRHISLCPVCFRSSVALVPKVSLLCRDKFILCYWQILKLLSSNSESRSRTAVMPQFSYISNFCGDPERTLEAAIYTTPGGAPLTAPVSNRLKRRTRLLSTIENVKDSKHALFAYFAFFSVTHIRLSVTVLPHARLLLTHSCVTGVIQIIQSSRLLNTKTHFTSTSYNIYINIPMRDVTDSAYSKKGEFFKILHLGVPISVHAQKGSPKLFSVFQFETTAVTLAHRSLAISLSRHFLDAQ